jgi:hypothetical protein
MPIFSAGPARPVGRLPQPRRIVMSTPVRQSTLAEVGVFVDLLAGLALDDWLLVGRSAIGKRSAPERRATACGRLDATIRAHDLTVAAWYVRDSVETAACLAAGTVSRWQSLDRRMFSAAHGAADAAALALLARDLLPANVFALLMAPFTSVAPEPFWRRT